jgi:hypothetical protein
VLLLSFGSDDKDDIRWLLSSPDFGGFSEERGLQFSLASEKEELLANLCLA